MMNLRDFYKDARQHGIRHALKDYVSNFSRKPGPVVPERPQANTYDAPSPNPNLSLEALATDNPRAYELAQPEGEPLIPKTIRSEDRPNLQKLLEALKAPYLHVIVSPDDNSNGYSEINVSVRARALPRDFDLQRYMSEQPLVEELELETLLEVFSQLRGVPIMVATHHVFGALKKLAEPSSYNPQMSRGRMPPSDYAHGNTQLRIGSTKFNVFYSEDSKGLTERQQIIKVGPNQWEVMGEEFPG